MAISPHGLLKKRSLLWHFIAYWITARKDVAEDYFFKWQLEANKSIRTIFRVADLGQQLSDTTLVKKI